MATVFTKWDATRSFASSDISGPRLLHPKRKNPQYVCFQKELEKKTIIHFNRIFHYKPSIFKYPLVLETPIFFPITYDQDFKHPEHDGYQISLVLANTCTYQYSFLPHLYLYNLYIYTCVYVVFSSIPDNLKASRFVGSILSSERRVGNSHAWLAKGASTGCSR